MILDDNIFYGAGPVEIFLANEKWWRPIREAKYGGGRLGVPA